MSVKISKRTVRTINVAIHDIFRTSGPNLVRLPLENTATTWYHTLKRLAFTFRDLTLNTYFINRSAARDKGTKETQYG